MKTYPYSLDLVPAIVEREAAFLRREAAAVIEVLPRGVVRRINPTPGLNVLAVLGPGSFEGISFSSSLLLEIGMGKSRPYHEARFPRHHAKAGRWLAKRHSFCSIEPSLYHRLSPTIMALLQRFTDERVAKWKRGPHNPYRLKTPNSYVTARGGLDLSRDGTVERSVERGVRVSVARRDQLLLADMYWLQYQSAVPQVRGFARFVDKLLKHVKSWKRNPKASWLRGELAARAPRDGRRTWAPYLLEAVPGGLPNGRHSRYYTEIRQEIARVTGRLPHEAPEPQLVERVCYAPSLRLNGTRVRDVSALRPEDAAKDCVVFEVFPSSPS